ncbi:hypothetical protein [Adhaeribacter radiodurans]|uniref:Uncharacterized protein n=1 Tax=Adhaeribacter radiodurans TaxID=2745197 RepID=A0A7L7L6H6_9BACT|nr:hypothetical protein [Adhaeribacter radiodurans]QMU28354.1 hypothetical protein HUW48_10055 [Adhaeribacter radiodurans]
MRINLIKQILLSGCFLMAIGIFGCKTSAGTNSAASATNNRNLPPVNVDIRGSIIMSRYNQGQVMLEIESFAANKGTRYNRAYVLVLPTTQIIGPDGGSISLSELRQGQNVAGFLRGGGKGNLVGIGVARKLWIEEGP